MSWFKVTIETGFCVEQVKRYASTGGLLITWTCSENDCSSCEGNSEHCIDHTLTVSTEGTDDIISAVSGCKLGNTLKITRLSGKGFTMTEIAVVAKQGIQI